MKSSDWLTKHATI